jgi:hypothetical protein
MIWIGVKSFEFLDPAKPKSIILSLPISFPSLTHLSLVLDSDVCTPPILSHLLSLKSLTNLRLRITKCRPTLDLMALQPLASVLTTLELYMAVEVRISNDSRHPSDHLSYLLLPFRSLTELSISIPTRSTSLLIEMTGSFIRQHWNKLDRTIGLYVTALDSAPLFRQFVLSASTLPESMNNNSLWFGIKLVNVLSLDEFNKFLDGMENNSLLVPSSSTAASTHNQRPTILLECTIGYSRGEKESLRVRSLERDMNNRVDSRGYTNMSSFSISTFDYSS